MKYFIQFSKILNSKQKKSFFLLTFLMFISMVFEIFALSILFILLNFLADIPNNQSIILIEKIKNLNFDYPIHLQILIFFLLIFFVKTIINICISWKENKYIFTTKAEIGQTFFKGYIYLPRIFHLRSNTSEIIKNLTTEMDYFIGALLAVSIIVMESIVLIGLVVFLLFINYKIAIISLCLLVVFSLLMNFINSKVVLEMGKKRIRYMQKRLQHIIEGLSGSKIFEITSSQNKLIDDFNVYNDGLADINTNVTFRSVLPKPLFELFILTITVIFLLFFLQESSQLKIALPTLGVFLSAAYRLVPSFGKIMSQIQKFQYFIPAAEKLAKDIDKFNVPKQTNYVTKKLEFKKSIKFNDVNFSYYKNYNLEKNLTFKNLNLEIKKNSKIGIIGQSGSGKSTFLDILMGLLEPQKGNIFIDEIRIQSIKNNWQKIIGCVPQEVFILDNTLKQNIAFGLEEKDIDLEKVNSAIKLANLDDLKNSLKFGIETLVGEKGSRLSGGQRQRIGIARALYNDPEILIFDEATNALDTETEKEIIQEIFDKSLNKTVIFVSHNKENHKFCDSIYEVKNKTLINSKN
jgi:ATP-binding cassette, subfamily B, bacterial PglK|tara:strand:+ start:4399 stop:6126 length:1728 start_codon:yes stop_codon:yes gene_type:complete